jgi:hypothetical protein
MSVCVCMWKYRCRGRVSTSVDVWSAIKVSAHTAWGSGGMDEEGTSRADPMRRGMNSSVAAPHRIDSSERQTKVERGELHLHVPPSVHAADIGRAGLDDERVPVAITAADRG